MKDQIVNLTAVDDPEGVLPSEIDPQQMWDRYSSRYEFPMALIAANLVLALMGSLVYLTWEYVNEPENRKSVPIAVLDFGEDETGQGNEGGPGEPKDKQITPYPTFTQQDVAQLPVHTPIPEVQADLDKNIKLDNPNVTVAIADGKLPAYASLAESLRKQLLQPQGGPATYNPSTSGNGGEKPNGTGGIGADSTVARTMRWTLLFKTDNGGDYLSQLAAMGAIVLVPLPPDNKAAYIFRDLRNPRPGEYVKEAEWKQLSNMVQFSDIKRSSVIEVAQSLNMRETPHSFWAFFPKALEHELSIKEKDYRGKRPEDILETKFNVVVRSGVAYVEVVGQKTR